MELKDYFTLTISVLAFFLSLTSLLMKGPENRRLIRNQLTDAISKLNAVNAEARKLSIEKAAERHTPNVNGMFSFYNDQRVFLARQAVFLIEQIPQYVSDAEYAVVARAFDSAGDAALATEYWTKCLDSCRTPATRAFQLRGYAAYLFNQGEVVEGRKRYHQSVESTGNVSDRDKHTLGETYLRWSKHELNAGFPEISAELVTKSRQAFESIGFGPLRVHGLEILKNTSV